MISIFWIGTSLGIFPGNPPFTATMDASARAE
jgi:hypothetical protein